ncbi:9552_t:CDS:2 [Diversispora eburnea]|uniref:9552_t:CDS:1 n=1 Tax=Diversispora eburnea TaxID=1213867 RepID=A0A9N8YM05_9GLOM|nr:9552_t:CDS:2 [Diversispora eburnea]
MPETPIYIQDYVPHTPTRPEKGQRPKSIHRSAPKIGNPTPLGKFMLSVYNRFGVSLFTGGVVQFAAGMWEFKVGNTFGGTGFSAFGGFWASYGVIFIPAFGIQQAFGFTVDKYGILQPPTLANNPNAIDLIYQYHSSLVTFIFTLACIRTNAGVLGAFVALTLSFGFEVVYHFFPASEALIKISGVFGSVLLTPDLSPISLPLWDLSKKE